jgi:hypothetical protein
MATMKFPNRSLQALNLCTSKLEVCAAKLKLSARSKVAQSPTATSVVSELQDVRNIIDNIIKEELSVQTDAGVQVGAPK